MNLNKESDLLFAIIKKMPSNELTQFKRFVKFEQQKPQLFLKMLDAIVKIIADWEIGENFPEEDLKKKCGPEISKKYTHYKYLLKKNVLNFNKYLLISDKKNENFKNQPYFINEMALCYSTYSRFGFYQKLFNRFTELAEEAYEAKYFALSIHLYESNYYFAGMIFLKTEDAIKEQKLIRDRVLEIHKASEEFSKTNFYKSYFFLANSLPKSNKGLIDEEVESFNSFKPTFYSDIAKIDYHLAEVQLSVFNNDYQKNLNANMSLIEYLEKNENISTKLIRHNFTARFNAFHTALHINNVTLAKSLLEDANNFLQTTDKVTERLKMHFYGYYLNGKITFNNYVDGDIKNLIEDVNIMQEAIKNEDISIAIDHKFHLDGDFAFSYYLSTNYSLCYDTVNNISSKNALPVLVLVCFILSQYHLFQFEFLESSYRAISRNQLLEENYSLEEIAAIRKIQSRLIKLSTTKNKKYVEEICQLILSIQDTFYLNIHKRIADTFKKQALI